MSIFANMIIRRMTVAEEIFQISTNHSFYESHVWSFGHVSPMFQVHFNMFLTVKVQPPNHLSLISWKSVPFLARLINLVSTSEPDAVDGNRNDLITIYYEAPQGLFNTSKSKNLITRKKPC